MINTTTTFFVNSANAKKNTLDYPFMEIGTKENNMLTIGLPYDSISGAYSLIKSKPKKNKTIPKEVYDVAEEVESNPAITNEEILSKFLATGYEYAENFAKYYIDLKAQK